MKLTQLISQKNSFFLAIRILKMYLLDYISWELLSYFIFKSNWILNWINTFRVMNFLKNLCTHPLAKHRSSVIQEQIFKNRTSSQLIFKQRNVSPKTFFIRSFQTNVSKKNVFLPHLSCFKSSRYADEIIRNEKNIA